MFSSGTMAPAPPISAPADRPVARDDSEVAQATMRRVSLRLLPFLFVLFVFNYIDRANVAMAKLQMNRDLASAPPPTVSDSESSLSGIVSWRCRAT